jgi:3-oxoacyl-ACP reductase-like protein
MLKASLTLMHSRHRASVHDSADALLAPGEASSIAGSGALGDQKAIDDKVKKQVADQQTQLKAFCEQARTNLAQLQNNPRLREEVEGELRRLSDAQRQERIAEAQKQIAENCE